MSSRRKVSGKWQVERERCQISDRKPPSQLNNAVSVSGVVPVVMKKLGLAAVHLAQILEENWVDLVGAAVAGHTRPAELKGGELTVFVDSSVWLNELSRYGRKKMLENFKAQISHSKITKIIFRLDPDSQTGKRQ